MRGSRVPNPVRLAVLALFGGAAALFAAPVLAADPNTAAVGPPTPLFTPSSPTPATAAPPRPMHSAAIASPGKHPATPVRRIPLDGKPLIPPAVLPAKLGPPPEPRPALSLETDLEPLPPAGSTPQQPIGATGAAAPQAAKPPSS